MSRQLTVYPCQYPNCKVSIEAQFECPRKYCDIHRVIARKEYQKLRARKRRNLKIERICVRCHGHIIKPYKQRYCTDYCYWLNYWKNRGAEPIRRSLRAV